MNAAAASRRSALLPIALLVLATLAYLPMRLAMENLDAAGFAYRAMYIYGTALQVLFAVVILSVAARIGMKENVGKQWLLLGLAVAVFAIGDIIWTIFEVYLGIDPYPSIADIFYTAEYVFFLGAIVLAVRSYRGLVKTRTASVYGIAVAVVGIAAVYMLLLRPYIFPDSSGLELIVSTLYPLGDVAFMLAPAVTLAIVVAQLGAGRFARPWWIVVAGAAIFALTDSFYAYADWAGIGLTVAIDMGWLAGNLLFAAAALVALDAYRVK